MKIIKDSRIRIYELTYLMSANLTSDEAKQVADDVAKVISKYKGKVLESEDWGKRELSYTIKHGGNLHREATYTHLKIELDTTKAQVLEKDIYLMPQVIRHLLVVAQDDMAEIKVKSVKKTTQAKTEPVEKKEKRVEEGKETDIEDKK